ncbi:MarR family winged helix-turn-helix transcriptional regulator [Cellulomonas xiejunii]|uniref:MarR family winged helix-turn-helix transcriptional regulator n=2 Tax=Cellulomonas xiejunii TaxID=2968083 RepID=A0ABY5KSL2_9CELL|nr:MarR family winged helix-turn-helix transcriptional regulator [Cellulomonas xiejunii]MCC2321528.1 MarR family winged helix-turn-helix transcriptional regulator [Cellulomonas xiejunii]MCC2323320.1 MarR family winged helix-turn-helix transcriptional regulator [Cellulomonas xiejunii]UUI72100.1 MarR family winged helix-turn-helix transcriptional regulator [Cellulomonas xiejunii]
MEQRTDDVTDGKRDLAPSGAPSDPPPFTVGHDDRPRERREPARRPPPSEELLELLHDVLRAVRRDATERLGHDITPGQLRLLRTLDRLGRPQRLGELAAVLDVAPRSVTSKVDHAEADGWIRRVPDPRDRRATLVELTEEGHDLLETVSAQRHEGVRARLEVLDADEQRTLLELLRRVALAPDDAVAPPPPSPAPNSSFGGD